MKIVLSKGCFMGPISGADETLVTYATQLKLAGHDPSVLLVHPHAHNDQYYVRLIIARVPVSSIAPSSTSATLTARRRLLSRINRVIHFSNHTIENNAQNIE